MVSVVDWWERWKEQIRRGESEHVHAIANIAYRIALIYMSHRVYEPWSLNGSM